MHLLMLLALLQVTATACKEELHFSFTALVRGVRVLFFCVLFPTVLKEEE